MQKDQPSPSRGKLDRQSWLLLAVNALFIIASALSGTFIGVYLWKASHNFAVLGWFTLLTHFCMAVTFWTAGYWVKKGHKMMCFRLGIGMSAVFYAIVLLLGINAVHYIWLLGIVQGLGTGLFWLVFNVIYFEVTDPDNRDRFNGWTGIIGAVAGMVAPWCSGLLITRMAAETGYRMVFMISFGTFVAAVVVSIWLRNRKSEGDYEWKLPVRIFQKPHTAWKTTLGALAAQGFRESVFGVMIGLLVYIQTGSEMKLGNFTLITSAIAFLSFYAAGKWIKPIWRSRAMLAGTIVMTAVIIPFFFGISYKTMLIFGIGTSLFIPLYTIPMTSAVFDLIGQHEESAKQRVEYVVLRELALCAGRVVSMIIFIITIHFSKAPIVLNCLLLFIGCSPLVSWLMMRRNFTRKPIKE
jgi:YQGE family putative transporter